MPGSTSPRCQKPQEGPRSKRHHAGNQWYQRPCIHLYWIQRNKSSKTSEGFVSSLNVIAQLIVNQKRCSWSNDWSLNNWYVHVNGMIFENTHRIDVSPRNILESHKKNPESVWSPGIWQHVGASDFKNTQPNKRISNTICFSSYTASVPPLNYIFWMVCRLAGIQIVSNWFLQSRCIFETTKNIGQILCISGWWCTFFMHVHGIWWFTHWFSFIHIYIYISYIFFLACPLECSHCFCHAYIYCISPWMGFHQIHPCPLARHAWQMCMSRG